MSKFFVTATAFSRKHPDGLRTEILSVAGAGVADTAEEAIACANANSRQDGFEFLHASAGEIEIPVLAQTLHRITLDAPARIRCPDFDEGFWEIYQKVHEFTLTTPERLFDLYKTVEYVVRAGVPGNFVECGVWRGGSVMCMALSLLKFNYEQAFWTSAPVIQLFDTFEGMPLGGDNDYDVLGNHAQNVLAEGVIKVPLEEVKANVESTKYPPGLFEFHKGRVEETLKDFASKKFSIIRLDTDWYESTKCELEVLWPRLSVGGFLIIDDYGAWKGARKATDEFFADKPSVKMTRLDDSCRVIQKW